LTRAAPSSWSPFRKLGGYRCARITLGHGSHDSLRRLPKTGRGRITMCSVSPRETLRPRGLYRHAPVPGRQVRQGADFECVECARLSDESLVPTRTAQLAFPDFDREGCEVVGLLARPFRGFLAGSLDLRGNPFLAAPLWGAAGGGLFHDASLLEDVGKESALRRTGTSRLAQWFPGIQPFP